jgi:hypothetical protein
MADRIDDRTLPVTTGAWYDLPLAGRRTQVAKGEVCKTSMQRFESARRLSFQAGVAQAAEAADLKSAQWGFESLHQHQHALLRVIDDCVRAIASVLPGRRVGTTDDDDG